MSDPRVALAAERTLLAWIRTGLAMMGFGFVVARFGFFLRELAAVRAEPMARPPGLSLWIGVALVVLGVVVTVLAAIEHLRLHRRLAAEAGGGVDAAPVAHSMLGVWVSFTLASIGVAMATYLVAVSR